MVLSSLTVFLYVFDLIELNGDFADPSSLRWGRSARTLPLPTATTRLAARSWPSYRAGLRRVSQITISFRLANLGRNLIDVICDMRLGGLCSKTWFVWAALMEYRPGDSRKLVGERNRQHILV